MGVVILEDEWIEKQVEVPPEYRRYVRREDLSKLPKGLKIYQGVRGGLYFDTREYERITGEKPEIGETREVGESREEKPRRRKGLKLYGLSKMRDPERRKQIENIFNDLNQKMDFRRNFGLKNGKIALATEKELRKLLGERYPIEGLHGVHVRRRGILINCDDKRVIGYTKADTLDDIKRIIRKHFSNILASKWKKRYPFNSLDYEATSFITVLLHEIGHYVWDKRSTPSERDELSTYYLLEKNPLTSYSKKNPDEFWAENFIWFILTPKLHKELYPGEHEFMLNWCKRHRINIKQIWKNLEVM